MLEELSIEELFAQEEEGEELEHEDEAPPNPVLPTGNEIVWAGIFFALLWALMKYVLLPPIQRTRAERAAKIAASKEAASGASSDVAEKQAAYDARINKARDEANEIMDAARGRAEDNRAKVMSAAEADVAEMRGAAEAALADARQAAVQTLRGDVSAVAVGAASSIVGRQLDGAGAQAAIDQVLDGDGA